MIKNLKVIKSYQKAVVVKQIAVSIAVTTLIGLGVVDTILKNQAMIHVEDYCLSLGDLYYVIDLKGTYHVCYETRMENPDSLTKPYAPMVNGYYQIDTKELITTKDLYGKTNACIVASLTSLSKDYQMIDQYIENDYDRLVELVKNFHEQEKTYQKSY